MKAASEGSEQETYQVIKIEIALLKDDVRKIGQEWLQV